MLVLGLIALSLIGLWSTSLGRAEHSAPAPGADPTAPTSVTDAAPLAQADDAAPFRDPVPRTPMPGHITFLDILTRKPPPLTFWRMRRVGTVSWDPLPTDRNGLLTLPADIWQFETPPGIRVMEPEVDLRSCEHRVVWCHRAHPIDLQILSRVDHTPIAGAMLRHICMVRADLTAMPRDLASAWSPPTESRADGTVTLDAVFFPAILRAEAAGFDPVLVHLKTPDPIIIAMDPANDLRRIVEVVSDPEDRPLLDASVEAWSGPLRQSQVQTGRIEFWVPRSFGAEDLLIFTAPDHLPAAIRWAALSASDDPGHKVRLRRTCVLVAHVDDPAHRPCQVLLLASGSGDGAATPFSRICRLDEATNRISVPAGISIDLLARSPGGSSQAMRIETQCGENHVRLRPDDGDTLELILTAEDGQLVAGSATISLIDGVERFVSGTQRGVIRAPLAARISQIAVRAEGMAAVRLRPNPDHQGTRGGRLDVAMTSAHPITLQVVDASGEGIPGVSVLLLGRERESLRRRFSPHPAWTIESRPPIRATTDALGVAHFLAPSGDYAAETAMPAEVAACRDLLPPPVPTDLHVSGPGHTVIVTDLPRSLLITAFDAASATLVRATRIRTEHAAERAAVQANPRWIWVPRSTRSITVESPGYLTARVDLPPSSHRVEILLNPGGAGTLHVEQPMDSSLHGAELTLRGVDPSGQRYRTRVTLSATAATPIHLLGASLDVSIDDLVWRGQHWQFHPVQNHWDAGGSLRFRAERK
jgi:hypothetical protein